MNWGDWALRGGRKTGKYEVEVRAETRLFFVSISVKHHGCLCEKAKPVKGRSLADESGRRS